MAGAEGDHERAARPLGAAEALGEAVGVTLPPSARADREAGAARARAAPGRGGVRRGVDPGRALAPDQALAEALEVCGRQAPVTGPG